MRSRSRLSVDEKAEIRVLAKRGVGGRQIARMLGRSPSTVQRLLQRECLYVAQLAWVAGLAVREKPATPEHDLPDTQGSAWEPVDEAAWVARRKAESERQRLRARDERRALETAAYMRRKAQIMGMYQI